MSDPWDQLPGESPESYARFLTFRNLGPGRSLALACNIHTSAAKRRKTPYASGTWQDDSAKNEWVARATAWDIHQISAQGDELARLWVGILVSAATKAAQKLADPRCKPKDFAQALSVVEKLSPYLTPDVLRSLQPPSGDPQPVADTIPLRAACE